MNSQEKANGQQHASDLLKTASAFLARAGQFRSEEAKEWGEHIDRAGAVPDALWARLRDLGFTGLTLPSWAGGLDLPLQLYFPILEEIARCHGSIRMVVHMFNSLWRAVNHGREDQRRYWLPRIAQGDAMVAFALTEPDGGTGIDLHTVAEFSAGRFVLRGRKHLITFADRADAMVVIAKTDRQAGRRGLTAFLLPRGRKGIDITPMPPMMGDRGSTHCVVTFNDCPVSEEDILGEMGGGFDLALRGFLDQSRACIAQAGVGLAQEALDVALDHCRVRRTFGRPLAARQAVQMHLAEMAVQIQAGRLLCMDAAERFDRGEEIAVPAAMAKAFTIRMLQETTDAALTLFGGIGYVQGSPMERLYRDARSLWFEEGTGEMQKMTIAEKLLADSRRSGPPQQSRGIPPSPSSAEGNAL